MPWLCAVDGRRHQRARETTRRRRRHRRGRAGRRDGRRRYPGGGAGGAPGDVGGGAGGGRGGGGAEGADQRSVSAEERRVEAPKPSSCRPVEIGRFGCGRFKCGRKLSGCSVWATDRVVLLRRGGRGREEGDSGVGGSGAGGGRRGRCGPGCRRRCGANPHINSIPSRHRCLPCNLTIQKRSHSVAVSCVGRRTRRVRQLRCSAASSRALAGSPAASARRDWTSPAAVAAAAAASSMPVDSSTTELDFARARLARGSVCCRTNAAFGTLTQDRPQPQGSLRDGRLARRGRHRRRGRRRHGRQRSRMPPRDLTGGRDHSSRRGLGGHRVA